MNGIDRQHGNNALPVDMRPAIIIPVYNHGLAIAGVISQAKNLGLPIIVVDDGSTDTTASIIKGIDGITICSHATNLGKGAAIRTGFTAALENACNWAITVDGDGQHKPEDAWTLLQTVQAGERCLVIGKRLGMHSQKNVPITSRFGRAFSNFWVWAAGGPWVQDSQSGFRLYPIPEALHLVTKARRYQFEVEILVVAKRHKLTIKEAPVQVIYQEKGVRVSHFQPWRDFLRNSATFNRLIWARIFSRLRP